MNPHDTQFETNRRRIAPSFRIGSRSWLAWLPPAERRTLARVTHAVTIPAGRPLVVQGAVADDVLAAEFFLIERGRATVIRDGLPIAELAPGDFFGEIALLQGGARTATVVAATRMRIRIVPKRQFAGLMRTLPTLARAVRGVTHERLLARFTPAATTHPRGA